ncbi:penicillin acylase family protein [Steroidobacter sp.]|uniref:penicillin acylase family protein n=1 Tax=Steroidobacter sp. TaxID=1978227 RepID=UPI001A50F1C6|nr:penicillin acylase family protein [Steroidobacter sp.]MBL8268824.1 penicillin acylase family protein [Steroidobacter sp.]
MSGNRWKMRALLVAVVCHGLTSMAAAATPAVELTRTQHGVVHVKSHDYAGLGYGFGFAHATDNVCLMARYFVTVNGEQSKYFGAGAGGANLRKDFYSRYYYRIDDQVRARFEQMSTPVKDLLRGYVAGYNSYLATTPPAKRPVECRDAAWVRPITLDDMYRVISEKVVLTSAYGLADALVAATPPVAKTAGLHESSVPAFSEIEVPQIGSNGWAFGRDVTDNGRGLLLGNPHFPWRGENRFYQIHLTIPGELDVMGATIPPLPVVGMGFNKDVAWTHTVSYAKRFTLFELSLDATDPLRYRVDGGTLAMTPVRVSVEVKGEDGKLGTREHTFYDTVFGPVLIVPSNGLKWTATTAYALGDVNRLNTDAIDTWLNMAKARNVAELRAAAGAKSGLPWINTLATDRNGDALYADFSRIPNVSQAMLDECKPSAAAAALADAEGIFVLDGTRERCNWTRQPRVPGQGIIAAAQMPTTTRSDYVANANDTYWLVNAKSRLQAQSPLNGRGAIEQGFRSRMQLFDIERRLAGSDGLPGNKVSPATVESILFSNRNYAALLTLDDLLQLCGKSAMTTVAGKAVDLAPACKVLAAWNRKDDPESRGVALFREFWAKAEKIENLYAVPFDAADPVNTPRQLNIGNAEVAKQLLVALGEAVNLLGEKGIALDAPLSQVQTVTRNGRKIAIPGGDGGLGVLNAIRTEPLNQDGYNIVHGTSYLQIVTFDDQGPVVKGLLTYDQSVDEASPFYSSQVELFSRSQLYRFPFTSAQIRADAGFQSIALPDDRILHSATPAALDAAAAFVDLDAAGAGCAVGTWQDGKRPFVDGFGMADVASGRRIDADTVFDAASLSKQFTAFAVLLLERQGRLSLDDSIRKFVPALGEYAQLVTVRHLMHHTGGLRDYVSLSRIQQPALTAALSEQQTIALLARQKAAETAPGTEYMYSNTGYFLLSQVVERASGQPFGKFLAANVFGPLGMRSTSVGVNPALPSERMANSYMVSGGKATPAAEMFFVSVTGAGDVRTSITDLSKWMENYWTARVGGKALIQRMAEVGALADGKPIAYAAGLTKSKYRGLTLLRHGGSAKGFRHSLLMFPDQRFAVTVLCNRSDAAAAVRAEAVAEAYLRKVMLPKEEASEIVRLQAEPERLDISQAAAGLYRNTAYGEYLTLERNPAGDLKLRHRGTPLTPQLFAPGVYRTEPLQSFPVYLSFGRDRLSIEFAGDFDEYRRVTPWMPADLGRWAGLYRNGENGSQLRVIFEDGKLSTQLMGMTLPLVPGEKGELTAGRGAIAVPADGPPDWVTLQMIGLRGLRFERVSE